MKLEFSSDIYPVLYPPPPLKVRIRETEPIEVVCDFSMSVGGKSKSYNTVKITLQPPVARYGEEGTLVSMNEISGLIKTDIPLSDSAKKRGIDSLLNEGVIRQNNFGNYLRVNQK